MLLVALAVARAPAPEFSLPFAGEGGKLRAERAYGALPLAFEPSAGRGGPRLDFLTHTSAGSVYLTGEGATLVLGEGRHAEAIGLELIGTERARPSARERLPGVVNDLRGDDPQKWRTGIPTFERVRYPSVYPGIDLDWYGDQSRLEYDFRLAPGANPDRIAIRIPGAEELRLAPDGDLLIDAGRHTIHQRAPVAYQPRAADGRRTPVRAAFSLEGDVVRFRLGPHDEKRPLVIDPVVLAYSTYLGGTDFDAGNEIAVDFAGAAYITGFTNSTDFDTVGEIEGDSPSTDAFVSKLAPAGSALVYSTYLGGNFSDEGNGIAVDSAGAAYVTGDTESTDFNTVGAIEGDSTLSDAFVSKLAPAGNALAYSTYLGGNGFDGANEIAIDSAGAAYVTGETGSTDFDTVGQIEGDSTGIDAFVSKLAPAGNALVLSTYLGGNGNDRGHGVAVDSAGAAYVTGSTLSTDFNTVNQIEGDSTGIDAFVSKIVVTRLFPTTPDFFSLRYSTYLGGNSTDLGTGIAVDSGGAAYVTGVTGSTDFDTVNQIEGDSATDDAFVSKLTFDNPTSTLALAYSTYLGGNGSDRGNGIAVDSAGAAYVTGSTDSTDFNTLSGIEGDSPSTDAFVSKLLPAGSAFVYSTYLGGNGSDLGNGIAVDSAGDAYVTGSTGSTDFDTMNHIEGDSATNDAFVSKLTLAAPGAPQITDTDPDPPANDNNPEVKGSAAADSTVKLYESNNCSGPVEVQGGSAQFASPGLTATVADNQTATFTATATDAFGTSPCSSPFAYVEDSTLPPPPAEPVSEAFDSVPPDTVITKRPKEKSSKKTSTFEFQAVPPEPGVTFECTLDGKQVFKLCSSGIQVKVKKGKHTFQVQATDAAGNSDPTPAVDSWKVKKRKKK